MIRFQRGFHEFELPLEGKTVAEAVPILEAELKQRGLDHYVFAGLPLMLVRNNTILQPTDELLEKESLKLYRGAARSGFKEMCV